MRPSVAAGMALCLVLLPLIAAQENDTAALLQKAAMDIEAMRQAGIGVTRAALTYEFAVNLSEEQGKETIIAQLADQIATTRRVALETKTILDNLRAKIPETESEGVPLAATRETVALAQSAFEREDYLVAYNRASQASLTFLLETKGEFNLPRFVRSNFWYVIPIALYLLYIAYAVLNRYIAARGEGMLRGLTKEEVVIQHLIKQLQDAYYLRSSVPRGVFHKGMFQYNRRLARIQRLKSMVKMRMLRYVEQEELHRSLVREERHLMDGLKKLQTEHFSRQEVDKEQYGLRHDELVTRLAEVELMLAIQEQSQRQEKKAKHLIMQE